MTHALVFRSASSVFDTVLVEQSIGHSVSFIFAHTTDISMANRAS